MALRCRILRCSFNIWRATRFQKDAFSSKYRYASSVEDKVLSESNLQTKDKTAAPVDDLGQIPAISFSDPREVFKHKTTWELIRALCVLKICSYDVLVDNSERLMRLGPRFLGTRLFTALMKATFYRQFSVEISRQEIFTCVARLHQAGIGLLLSVPIEEDAENSCGTNGNCDENLQTILDCINMAADVQTTYPMMSVKLTALLPASLSVSLSKICPEPSRNPDLVKSVAMAMRTGKEIDIVGLSDQDRKQLNRGLTRLKVVGELAVEKDVIVMVDAEYICINPALNLLSLAMMLNYNINSALVFYTYQNYLKATHERLRRDMELIDGASVCFGAKIVRGAYLEKERKLAKEQGYPDPVHDTFYDTTNMYNNSMELMLSQIKRNPDRIRMIIASHNQETMKLALNRLRWYGISQCSGSVFLGQVYGIADHLTYLLGSHGYPVYKCVPCGSLTDTLPYLSRRVKENRAILQGMREERGLLKAAVRARLWGM